MMSPSIVSSSDRVLKYRKRKALAQLFVPESVIGDMTDHADVGLDENREVMGLIVGRVYRDENGEYAVAERAVTSKLEADCVSVRFDREAFEGLFEALGDLGPDETVIGWYHSHLDIGCFMSPADIATQDGIFGGECGYAVVIDPARQEMKVFDSNPGNPRTADMIVLDNE
jgi:proteasome lid subunit RPN8/RPN11